MFTRHSKLTQVVAMAILTSLPLHAKYNTPVQTFMSQELEVQAR